MSQAAQDWYQRRFRKVAVSPPTVQHSSIIVNLAPQTRVRFRVFEDEVMALTHNIGPTPKQQLILSNFELQMAHARDKDWYDPKNQEKTPTLGEVFGRQKFAYEYS